MQVASSQFPSELISELNSIQYNQQQVEEEVSSGLQFQQSSQNPVGFEEAQNEIANENSIASYTSATSAAQTQANYNYNAASSLQQLLTNASEIATQANGASSTTDLQALGTEIGSIINQVVAVANQKDANGNYLFGGTSNEQPIDPSTNTYNTSTNAETTQAEIQPGYNFTTGIVAGRSTGTPPVDGFLVNTASGVDVLSTLTYIQNQLNAGNANNVITTGLTQLQGALGLSSQYVAKTAAQLQALTLNTTALNNQQQNAQQQLSTTASANLATAATQLQALQTSFEATAQAGSQILNLNLLNYLSSSSSS